MPYTLKDFTYTLPPELIAQHPAPRRDSSRLMLLDRARGTWSHHQFSELPELLTASDFLVINDTRVFPARLVGRKTSGGRVEFLLHHLPEAPPGPSAEGVQVWASCRGHRLKVGQVVDFGPGIRGEIREMGKEGRVLVHFPGSAEEVRQLILTQGQTPLPPYIRRPPKPADLERYQTVYAARVGAVAAPTAGLHFTLEVLKQLKARGVEVAALTLHVGPGTFMPVRTEDYRRHRLQAEYFILPPDTAARLNTARAAGKSLVAVGTTCVRVLEHCLGPEGFSPQDGWCDLYITPGYRFRAVDRLLTNFHLPRSTLLLLVAAFAGRDLILAAYQAAIEAGYRFYSYGDCMLIV